MSAILKFDFQKREQLRFSEVNYLNYTKKDPILHVATIFSLKQGETRTSHGPILHPLIYDISMTMMLKKTTSDENRLRFIVLILKNHSSDNINWGHIQAHTLFHHIPISKKSLEVSTFHNFHLKSEFSSKCPLTCAKYFDASRYIFTNKWSLVRDI